MAELAYPPTLNELLAVPTPSADLTFDESLEMMTTAQLIVHYCETDKLLDSTSNTIISLHGGSVIRFDHRNPNQSLAARNHVIGWDGSLALPSEENALDVSLPRGLLTVLNASTASPASPESQQQQGMAPSLPSIHLRL